MYIYSQRSWARFCARWGGSSWKVFE